MQALAAKRNKAGPSSGEGTPSGNSTQEETTAPAPAPASGLSAPDNPDQSTPSISDGDVRDCLDEWVRALASDDLQMLSLLLFEFVRRETSATVMNAAAAVSKVVHRDEKTIAVRFSELCSMNIKKCCPMKMNSHQTIKQPNIRKR